MLTVEMQRLVDGELDHSARARLLGSLSTDATEWRALALALLEEQQWSSSICNSPLTIGDPPSASASPESYIQDPLPNSITVRPVGMQRQRWSLALAASVLLMIGMSGGISLRAWQSLNRDQINVDGTVASNSRLGQESRLAGSQSTIAEIDRGPDGMQSYGGRNEAPRIVLSGAGATRSEIPLVDARDIDPQLVLANEAYEMAKLDQRLRRKGYRLDAEPQMYTGRLNDGRQIVVPVHNVALRSIGL